MLTFNSGMADQPGAHDVEMVDINKNPPAGDANVFSYRALTIKDGKSELSHANSARCKTCHGEPARPIYPGYPEWEGSFNSLHNGQLPAAEVEGFREFMAAAGSDPSSRYRFLELKDPFSGEPRPIEKTANFGINIELASGNAIRVARLLAKTPDFQVFKFAIAGAFLECENVESFIPTSLAKTLHGSIEKRFSLKKKWSSSLVGKTYEKLRRVDSSPMLDALVNFDDGEIRKKRGPKMFRERFRQAAGRSKEMERLQFDTITIQSPGRGDPLGGNLRFLLESRGEQIDNYFSDLMQPTYRYHGGSNGAAETVAEMARHDPELAKLTRGLRVERHGAVSYVGNKKMCDDLKRRSLIATKNFKSTAVDALTEATTCINCDKTVKGNLKPLPENSHHRFVKNCAACHDDDLDYAPRIPFGDAAKFQAWLRKDDNAAKVRDRLIHPDEEKRMPQNKRLSDEEVNNLIRFVSVGE